MRYLVDTDWLIDAFIGIPVAVSTLREMGPAGLSISIISVGEVLEGAYTMPDPAAKHRQYQRFLAPFPVITLSEPIMDRFARERSRLRRAGLLIVDMDLLIGVTAAEQRLVLLTRNLRHFEHITDLQLYQPT